MTISAPVIAGTVSTIFFISAELPMVLKAFRTRNLSSYSLGNILIANAGNLVYSIYVFSLPPGPIWLMHTFYLTTTAVMLAMYARYEGIPNARVRQARHRLACLLKSLIPELPHLNTPFGE
jgi:hypothetical protein